MLNLVEAINRVSRGTLEVRSTPRKESSFVDDMRRFMAASNLPVDFVTNTPSNGVLLHMFGIATNQLLTSAAIVPIDGADWIINNNQGTSILTGLVRAGFDSNTWLRTKFDPTAHTVWRPNPGNIVPGPAQRVYQDIVDEATIRSYPTTQPNVVAFSVETDTVGNLFSSAGVYGRARLQAPRYYLSKRTGNVGASAIMIGNNPYLYRPVSDPATTLRINGVNAQPGQWIYLHNELSVSTITQFNGAFYIEFDITLCSGGPNSAWFSQEYDTLGSGLVDTLPPFPVAGSHTWRDMYKMAVEKFGADSPSAINPDLITRDYVELILLLNHVFSNISG